MRPVTRKGEWMGSDNERCAQAQISMATVVAGGDYDYFWS